MGYCSDKYDAWLLVLFNLICATFATLILWGVTSTGFAGIIAFGLTYGTFVAGFASLWTGLSRSVVYFCK
jgi:MFS transporter, MCT family, solute carrier family 16 (monocarboxylic acid transporters), member 10